MPTKIRPARLAEISSLDDATNANVRLGGYDMDKLFPVTEIECFHMELSEEDVHRIFLLYEATFIPHTKHGTCKIVDILSTAEEMATSRLRSGTKNELDLSVTIAQEPVFVTTNVAKNPFVAIDGNHRLTAHFAQHRSVNGVKVFVAVHKRMFDWHFIPPLARKLATA